MEILSSRLSAVQTTKYAKITLKTASTADGYDKMMYMIEE